MFSKDHTATLRQPLRSRQGNVGPLAPASPALLAVWTSEGCPHGKRSQEEIRGPEAQHSPHSKHRNRHHLRQLASTNTCRHWRTIQAQRQKLVRRTARQDYSEAASLMPPQIDESFYSRFESARRSWRRHMGRPVRRSRRFVKRAKGGSKGLGKGNRRYGFLADITVTAHHQIFPAGTSGRKRGGKTRKGNTGPRRKMWARR